MTSPTQPFDALSERIAVAPVSDLPEIIGGLAVLDAQARVRIAQTLPPSPDADDWLTVDAAAGFLSESPRWVKDHAKELGAAELPGRAGFRFSRRGLQRWLRKRVKA